MLYYPSHYSVVKKSDTSTASPLVTAPGVYLAGNQDAPSPTTKTLYWKNGTTVTANSKQAFASLIFEVQQKHLVQLAECKSN